MERAEQRANAENEAARNAIAPPEDAFIDNPQLIVPAPDPPQVQNAQPALQPAAAAPAGSVENIVIPAQEIPHGDGHINIPERQIQLPPNYQAHV